MEVTEIEFVRGAVATRCSVGDRGERNRVADANLVAADDTDTIGTVRGDN